MTISTLRAELETAFVFPGQGAQNVNMLDRMREWACTSHLYDIACELMSIDIVEAVKSYPALLTQNHISSLLIVLSNIFCAEHCNAANPGVFPLAVAGYSVGQFSALSYAGVLSSEDLVRLVFARANIMTKHIRRWEKTAMLAIIGVERQTLDDICKCSQLRGEWLQIANENAPRNFTLSGTLEAIDFALESCRALRPRVIRKLNVEGAWHSKFLEAAVSELKDLLGRFELRLPKIPVIDNVTGNWFPNDLDAMRELISIQVAAPVQWNKGLTTLFDSGIKQIAEIGFGCTLTSFGIYALRKTRHIAVFRSMSEIGE